MIRLLLHCGVTLQELIELDMGDLELDTLRIRGKRGERKAPLDETAKTLVDNYLAARIPPIDGSNALFVSSKESRIKRGAVQKMLRKVSKDLALSEMITLRDLILTCRERTVSEIGHAQAATLSAITTGRYFRRVYGMVTKAGDYGENT